MGILKDCVIVIKSINYSEADKILTVYGKNFGKYSVFARGLRKITSRNRGNLQTISVSNITFYEGKNMGTLVESDGIYISELTLGNLKNIERVLLLVNKLIPEGEVNIRLFEILEKVIRKGFDTEIVNKFRMLFLKMSGILPAQNTCVVCSREKECLYFNLENFTQMCENCYSMNTALKKNGKIVLKQNINYTSSEITKAIDEYFNEVFMNY